MTAKWFWGVLAFWTSLGAGAFSWALIWSPLRLGFSEIADFQAQMNGGTSRHKIDHTDLSPGEGALVTAQELRRRGWTPLSGPLPWDSLLLGLKGPSPMLGTNLRIDLYRKKEDLLVAGFLRAREGTYRWVAELPRQTIPSREAGRSWDFPLKPPPAALEKFQGSWGGLKVLSWSIPKSGDPRGAFKAHCSEQGFHCRPEGMTQGLEVIWVSRRSQRLLALLEQGIGSDHALLAEFPDEGLPDQVPQRGGH